MELASSHSSDEEDTTTQNGTLRVHDRRPNPPQGKKKPLSPQLVKNIVDFPYKVGAIFIFFSVPPKPIYQPNIVPMDSALSPNQIVEGVRGSPVSEHLARGTSPLGHNIRSPIYATHWSSQLPPAHPGLYKGGFSFLLKG